MRRQPLVVELSFALKLVFKRCDDYVCAFIAHGVLLEHPFAFSDVVVTNFPSMLVNANEKLSMDGNIRRRRKGKRRRGGFAADKVKRVDGTSASADATKKNAP